MRALFLLAFIVTLAGPGFQWAAGGLLHAALSTETRAKAGSQWDPNGAQTEAGSAWDPNGGAQTEAGSAWDPNG